MNTRNIILLLVCLLAAGSTALAGAVPDQVNFQGVLRDSADDPQDGTFSMEFRYFSAEVGGDEILIEYHPGVTVTGGLFNVILGTGTLTDGSSSGTYGSLAEVFRDYGEVHLALFVDDDALTPRIPVASAAYALNAEHLDGLDSTAFSAAKHNHPGADITSPVAQADSATTAAAADDAALLGGQAPAFYLDTSGSNQTKAGTLTVGELSVSGRDMWLNSAGSDGNESLYFFNSGSPTGEHLRWKMSTSEFELSDALLLGGALRVGGASTAAYNQIGAYGAPGSVEVADWSDLYVTDDLEVDGAVFFSGTLYMKNEGPDGDQPIYFYNSGSPTFEAFSWDEDDSRFELTDTLAVSKLRVGSLTDPTPPANHFGISGSPSSGQMLDPGDLYLEGSLELDQSLWLNGTLRMDDDGPDGDQFIYFFNSSSPTGESLRWEDSYDFFELSDDVSIAGTLRVGTSGAFFNDYNRIGSGGPHSPDIADVDDLYIADDLELDGELLLNGSLTMDENGLDGEQNIRFYNDGSPNGERFQWDDVAERFEVSDDFHVFGEMSATTKNFVQNHPYRDDLEVVYTSLEGPEAAVFTRGHGRLEEGTARIVLDETFALVASPDLGLSAHLTPRGSWADLYVESLTPAALVVRDGGHGSPDAAFDYVVFGLRVGFEEHPVLRRKRAEGFVPPAGFYERHYRENPELRAYNALERYRGMEAAAHLRGEIDLTATRALREAIGEHDPAFDFPPGAALPVAHLPFGPVDSVPSYSGPESPGAAPPVPAAVVPPDGRSLEAVPATAVINGLLQDEQGNVYARSFRPSAGDLASLVAVAEPVGAGDVLVIDPERSGLMGLARRAGDPAVFGVVAADAGVVLGGTLPNGDATGTNPAGDIPADDSWFAGASDEAREPALEVPVAVSGVALCKADAGYGSIRPGDLLTTSPTPGHAMRAQEPEPGAVLGKALEFLDHGTGTIRILVTLR